ncbi:MAG: S9 family peptidase [Alphaproteobacteria bacterium]
MDEKKPPSIRKEFCEIVKFGDKRTDPYRWLRDSDWQAVLQDPSALTPEIKKHIDAENQYFDDYTKEFSAFTAAAAREMKGRLRTRESSVPERDGAYEYWSEYREGGNYQVYMQKNTATGAERVLLDGDKESVGRKFFDVADLSHSPDHKTAAYMVDYEGAGNFSLKFRDIDTGLDMPETLENTKGQVIWSTDSSQVYYTECDGRNIAKRVKMHVIGTKPEEDTVVYDVADNELNLNIRQSQSGKYIFIETIEGSTLTVETRFLKIDSPAGTVPSLIHPRSEGHEYHVEHRGEDLYILTNTDGAANGKIMRAPVATPGRAHWVDVIPYDSGSLITDFITFENFIVRQELRDAMPRIVISDYAGNECVGVFPAEPCSLSPCPDRAFDAEHLTVEYRTPANPGEIYDLDLRTGKTTLLEKLQLPDGHKPEDYVVERKFVTSRDGADIPVTILRHKSTKTDGSSPLFLHGYGAYGGGIPAEFSSAAISLADRGVIYAIAHVHGGNEKGQDWYLHGRRKEKWNTFHDFIDVAESLTDMGYGEKGKIVIEGRSAGGLLIGAVLNEKPELFAGAIAGEAFLDVMNTMSDPSLPWVYEERREWGDPEDEKDFHNMRSYSPYDNIRKDKKYPPVLATTGLSDPCVMYWEPAKWIARLRDEAQGGPFYLKVHTDSGHEGASARLDNIDEVAVETGFILHQFQKCGYDLTPKTGPRAAAGIKKTGDTGKLKPPI